MRAAQHYAMGQLMRQASALTRVRGNCQIDTYLINMRINSDEIINQMISDEIIHQMMNSDEIMSSDEF